MIAPNCTTTSNISINASETFKLINSFTRILENPLIGIKYEEVLLGLFGYKVKKHIVFYQLLSNQEILIIRILHESMDYKRHLLKS